MLMAVRRLSTIAAVALTVALSTAVATCGSDLPNDGTATVDVVADGFDGPNQIADGPGGSLIVAQLAGGENDASGQVVVFDPITGTREVVLDGLDKPTGVLWRPGELWVMARRSLLRAPWPGKGPAGPTEVVLDDLPFNGRSEGTLTPLADGRFLYNTTGALSGGSVVEGSGTLWAFDPSTRQSTPVATGAKNAYAHAVTSDGRIATTEIGDTGGQQPPEELDVLELGTVADLGWPACDATIECRGVLGPVAVFPPSATPTGVAVVDDDAFVALFVEGKIVRVPLAGWSAGDTRREPQLVVDGLQGPHTVLARPDGTLWVSEHLTGRILSITP